MMRTVGRSLRRELGRLGVVVETEVSIGSGLARLDLFEWHEQAEAVMRRHQAETVLIMMGANDNQPMRTAAGVLPFGTPGWDLEYGRRVGKMMDLLLAGGANRVIWLGLPCMREEALSRDVAAMGRLIQQQAEARESVLYFPTVDIFCPDRSGYRSYITLPSGMPLDARAEDGVHLSRQGAEHLASVLIQTFFKK